MSSNWMDPETACEPVDAVILAGSTNRIPLYPGIRPGPKALVPIRGRPFLAYVVDALLGARCVRRVILIGGPEVREAAAAWPGLELLPDTGSLVDNAWSGLQAAGTDRVLFCNPDQPLLRPEMVDDFVARSEEVDADMLTSWVGLHAVGRYEEAVHKFARFGDGTYAHGNLFLARRRFPESERLRKRLDRIYHARKSNLRFAWELGLPLFLRYLICLVHGRLPTLRETLDTVGAHFGVRLEPVFSDYPEIVMDVDEPEDYRAAERYLAPEPSAARTGVPT